MMETDGRTDGRAAKKPSLLRFLPLGVAVAALAAVFAFGMDDFLSFEVVKTNRQAALDWYEQNRVLAIFYFVIGYALVVALSVPGAVWLSLAGGFLFGTVLATLYVVVAATLGALGIFLIARYALANFFHEKMGAAGRRMKDGFKENALSYLLVLRLVPLFPFWLVNMVPALLGVPVRTFVIGTFLGIIPGSAVFCSIGNGLGVVIDKGERPNLEIIFEPHIFGPLLGLAALALVPVVYKGIKASKDKAG